MTAFTAACDRQTPRTFNDFMEDPIARDGTIARCNQDRDATVNDPECANARRAAAAIAVQEERERSAALADESERKLRQLRLQAEREEEAAKIAAEEAAAKAQAEYEAQWRADEEAAAQAAVGVAPSAGESSVGSQAPTDTVAGTTVRPVPSTSPAPAGNLLPSGSAGPSELASSPPDGTRAEPPAAVGEPGIVPRPFRGSAGATP